MKLILTTAAFAGIVFVATPLLMAKPVKDNAGETKAAPPKVFSAPQKEGTKATCPVTGEQFTVKKDTLHVEHKGKHVYFCCPGCKKDFDKDPDKYTK